MTEDVKVRLETPTPGCFFAQDDSKSIRTSKTVNGIEHVYTLNGSQIVTESWTQSDVEHVIVYLYDFAFDVAPWILWGNSGEDSTNIFERGYYMIRGVWE